MRANSGPVAWQVGAGSFRMCLTAKDRPHVEVALDGRNSGPHELQSWRATMIS